MKYDVINIYKYKIIGLQKMNLFLLYVFIDSKYFVLITIKTTICLKTIKKIRWYLLFSANKSPFMRTIFVIPTKTLTTS